MLRVDWTRILDRLDVRYKRKRGVKMSPRFLARGVRRMKSPLIETEKTVVANNATQVSHFYLSCEQRH